MTTTSTTQPAGYSVMTRVGAGKKELARKRKELDRQIKALTKDKEEIDRQFREVFETRGAKVMMYGRQIIAQLVPKHRNAYEVPENDYDELVYS